jgi:1-acyl-sn-glycerol-3-phosphate acyltransferase
MSRQNKQNRALSLRVIISSFFVYAVGVVLTILFGGFIGLLSPFRYPAVFALASKIVYWWAKINFLVLRFVCGLTHQVYGQENIHKAIQSREGFVIVSNHQSAWDIPAFIALFNRVTFLTKKSLLRVPFFGWGLAMLKPIAIDRKKKTSAMRSLLNQGTQRLQEKYGVITFPEGTRKPMNTIGTYNMGSVILAQKANVKILPVVHNAGSFWARKSPWRFPGTIQVVVGESIEVNQHDPRKLTKAIEDWSRKQLELIQQNASPNPNLEIKIN